MEPYSVYDRLSLHGLDGDEVAAGAELRQGGVDRTALADRDRDRGDTAIRRHEPSAPPLTA